MKIGTPAEITDAVKKVCPIHGVSFVNKDDRSTWTISFRHDATPAQQRDAIRVLKQFDGVGRFASGGVK